jgi:hypothetical protein
LHWKRSSDKPDIVPEKLQSSVNPRILLLILWIVVLFQIYLYNTFPNPNDASRLVDIISIINPLISSIIAFIVAKKYWGSKIFGKAYLALALSLTMNFLGETVYGIYDTLGYDTNFGPMDILFYAFYPLVLTHLILNIRFFKPKISIFTKTWLVGIPLITISVYSILSFEKHSTANFAFDTGLIYVIMSSTILSGTLLGARVFKQGVLGKAWLVLLIGILLQTTGDVWYGYLDTFDQYTLTHPMNLLYYASYMVIAYALYKHQKII